MIFKYNDITYKVKDVNKIYNWELSYEKNSSNEIVQNERDYLQKQINCALDNKLELYGFNYIGMIKFEFESYIFERYIYCHPNNYEIYYKNIRKH